MPLKIVLSTVGPLLLLAAAALGSLASPAALQGAWPLLAAGAAACVAIAVWAVRTQVSRPLERQRLALAEAHHLHRLLFDAHPNAKALIDLDRGVCLDINSAALQYLGRRREEMAGRRVDALVRDEALLRFLALLREQRGRVDDFELAIDAGEGHGRWMLLSARPLDHLGQRAALIVGTDIDTLKQTQERLRRSERGFYALFEHAPLPMGYSVLEQQLTAARWNHAWYRAFGYTAAQADGRLGNEFGLWADPPARERFTELLWRDGSVAEYECELRRADGRVRLCELSANFVDLADRRLLVTTFVDVTDARSVASALDRSNRDLAQEMAVAQAVRKALSQFITDAGSREPFARLLADLRQLTGSPIGLIAECTEGPARGAAAALLLCAEGLDALPPPAAAPAQPPGPGHVLARLLQANAPLIAGRGAPEPEWQTLQGWSSCLGLPLRAGHRLVGIVLLADRAQGYDQALVQRLQPLLATAVQMVQARAAAAQRAAVERQLRLARMMVVGSNDAMLLVRDGRFTYCNPAALKLFRATRQTFIGRGPVDFSPPLQPDGRRSDEAAAERFERAQAGQIQRFDWQHRRADGELFVAEVSLSPTRERDSNQIVGVLRDVTAQRRGEQAQRENEELLSQVFDLVPEPMMLIDGIDGRYIDVNRTWVEKLGRSRESAIGRTTIELGLWPAEDFADQSHHRLAMREILLQGGRIDDHEVQLVPVGGGGIRHCLISARSVRSRGRPVGLWLLRDVTESRRAQQALRESEQRLKLILNTMAEGLTLHDAGGRVIDCNPAAERLLGVRHGELPGRQLAEVIGALLREDGSAFAADEMPVGLVLATGRSCRDIVGAVRRRDGTRVWLSANGEPLRDARGRLQMVVVSLSDITERKLAEIALRESETRFRRLFERAPVPMLHSDRNLVSLEVNRAWLRIVGWRPQDVPTEDDWYERVYPDPQYRRVIRERWRTLVEAARGEDVGPLEVEARCHDGQTRTMAMLLSNVVGGYVLSAFDLTERKRAEDQLAELNASLEQRVADRTLELAQALADLQRAQADLVRSEKLASLGEMVAGIAHELNTPIGNALMVATTLLDHERKFEAEAAAGLRRSVLDGFLATLREACQVLERNLHRSAELISSFKQVAVDQTSYQRRKFELAEVVREIALALRPTLRTAAVALHVEVGDGLRMDSYPGPLGQVLINLVNNAVLHAFAEGAGGNVRISAAAQGADRLRLSIADDGCGIPAANLDRIFDPFFTTRLGQGGSGLGLHIAYTLVNGLLGGRIAVHSRPGAGTRFDLDLPLKAPAAMPAPPRADSTITRDGSG